MNGKLLNHVVVLHCRRWAVSTVMTRQNQIPCSNGRQVLALIPLWDMCNHNEGEVRVKTSAMKNREQKKICAA